MLSLLASPALDKWRGLLRHFSAATVLPAQDVANLLAACATVWNTCRPAPRSPAAARGDQRFARCAQPDKLTGNVPT